jgi:hypothetical protein
MLDEGATTVCPVAGSTYAVPAVPPVAIPFYWPLTPNSVISRRHSTSAIALTPGSMNIEPAFLEHLTVLPMSCA